MLGAVPQNDFRLCNSWVAALAIVLTELTSFEYGESQLSIPFPFVGRIALLSSLVLIGQDLQMHHPQQ